MRLAIGLLALLAATFPNITLGDEPNAVAPAAKQEEEKPNKPSPKAKLGFFDEAPKLKVAHWYNGEAITDFQRDHVYVVDFWATWCGPCIHSMPHLDELAKKYSKQGLIVVALTSQDDSNTKESVEAFVNDVKNKRSFRFALCEDDSMEEAYMRAANQHGIPCSFIVNREGRIAFICHPLELDEVLPQVLDGTWNASSVEHHALGKTLLTRFYDQIGKDPEAAYATMERLEKEYPAKIKDETFQLMKVSALLRTHRIDAAKSLAEAHIKQLVADRNSLSLLVYAQTWIAPENNPQKKFPEVALSAVDAGVEMNDLDSTAMLLVADIYSELGEKEKSTAFYKKAIVSVPFGILNLFGPPAEKK